MNKVIVFSRFKSLLLLLFVFSSFGVNFVESFGMLSDDFDEKKDDNKGKSSTETISVLHDCYITFYRSEETRTVKTYDPIVNFISQGLYVFGFWDIYRYNDEDTLIPTTFFKKDATILNSLVNILTFQCYNFFSMKRYNKLSWLPFNSNNKLYLGITDLGFEGVAGGIAGVLLGRIALVLDISSVLNYSFVKDKVTFTLAGVRPLWLVLCYLQNNISSSYLEGLRDCIIDVYDKTSEKELSFKDDSSLCIRTYYISCFQILALEFKIMEHFSVQLCFGNLFYSLWNKLQKGEENSPDSKVSSTTLSQPTIDLKNINLLED